MGDMQKVLVAAVIGVGGGMILPRVVPVVAESSKPVFKVMIKATLSSVETVRALGAHLREAFEDAWAEIHAELNEKDQVPVEPLVETGPASPAERA